MFIDGIFTGIDWLSSTVQNMHMAIVLTEES